jgi:cobalt/nickel transport system ATP-binding protein
LSTESHHHDHEPADASDTLLVCEDLYYEYLERYPALDGVSLTVRKGERIALLGANGCGKSTLLKVLAGLVFPSRGSYRAFGHPVTEDTLEVFSPSVREEIAFGPLQLGLDREQTTARVDEVMALLGIADLADRAPFQLSGGQKKKVAIASVLSMNPEVLLFDEPTAALDPRTQVWLMELIEELGRAGKTIVHATHDLESLDRLADRCVVFGENHTLVAEGTPGEVLARRDLLLDVNLIHARSRLPLLHDAPA